MTNQDNRPMEAADLRQKAEGLARERAARSPEDSAALSPEEIRKTLHELRVHQIELEMQNEELRTAQTQIEAGRERYYDLYELAPVGYCTLSEQGLIQEANLTAATLLGAARSALVKQPISRFILKEDQDIYYLHRKKLFETGEPQECELRLVKPDGASFWAHLTATAAQAEDGAPLGRVVISDITERKRADEELRTAEETYRNIFLNAQVGMFRTDIKTGLVLDANNTYARRCGYRDLAEMMAANFSTVECYENPGDRDKMINLLKANGEFTDFEAPIRRKDGSTILLRWSARLVPDKGWIEGVSLDVTKERRAEERLQQAHERLNTVINSMDALVYIADMDNHELLFVNDYGRRTWGEIEDRKCWEAIQKDQEGPCACCTNGKLLDKEGNPSGVYVWESQNTVNGRWYDCRDMAIQWIDGRLVRMEIATDITERKQAEQEREKLQSQLAQAQKMESIGTLAGGIAHDFNNILSIIVGNTDLAMLDVPEWSPAQDNLKELREAALRARDLVKQILVFARQQEHTVFNIRLESIAEESIKMLRASIPTTVRIRKSIREGLPPVLADPSQIQQIIMNLCTNAGQVMGAEGGTLTFTLDSTDLETPLHTVVEELPPGRYVRMQVKDTGPGIPPELLDRIFDPFFTTKGVGEGTGLGLAVIHGIVRDRKGGITVESEEGLGTTFSIYLPASEVESVEVKTEEKTELPGGTERVLFVDDEPMIMKLGRHMLERQGYTVETRASGTDALECFSQDPHRFDLVVTDMTMPGMRGDRLAEEILAIRSDTPVILCTGYSRQISREKAEQIGIRAFVMKPLTQHELANTVRRVLDQKPRK